MTESPTKASLELWQRQVLCDDGGDDAQIEPLRLENGRLVRENNKLHLEIIKQNEKHDAEIKQLQLNCKRLESNKQDLLYLNSHYVTKLKYEESEGQKMKKRLDMMIGEKKMALAFPYNVIDERGTSSSSSQSSYSDI